MSAPEISAAFRQIAAEELGIPFERFTLVEGDTATVPNHGGTGGSSGIPRGGVDIRQAAATARQALLQMGAKQLNRPTSELTIQDGEVCPIAGGKGVTVASLIGGRQFDLKVDSKAPLKDPATYTVVGKPILRSDIPPKVTGTHLYVQNHTIPGMLHARIIRPPSMGAHLASVDEASIKSIPDVRIIRQQDFLGVIAKDEWAAIRAARDLKATWAEQPSPFATVSLDKTMAAASGQDQSSDQPSANKGDNTIARPRQHRQENLRHLLLALPESTAHSLHAAPSPTSRTPAPPSGRPPRTPTASATSSPVSSPSLSKKSA